MQDSPDVPHALDEATAQPSTVEAGWGWYLYGIVGSGQNMTEALRAVASVALEEGERPVEAVASDGLAAIVRRVPLADYAPEALRARAEDPAWIEAVARHHNVVVEAIHTAQTILPAQFGAVYPHAEDVRAALQDESATLLERLAWLRDCDEWGVRLYGDVAAIQRAAAEQESVRRLREELASASRGRAYLLERKLADELAVSAERLVDDLVDRAYDHMSRHTKARLLNRRLAGARIRDNSEQSAELAYATFLTPRASTDAFIADVRASAESQPGLWCEYSGPWPPYSFAAALGKDEEG